MRSTWLFIPLIVTLVSAYPGLAAVVTVDFSEVIGQQAMAYGTNEMPGQLCPSSVAHTRLAEINSGWCRYWLDGGVRPDASSWNWAHLDEGIDKISRTGAKPMVCFAGIPDWMAEDNPDRRRSVTAWPDTRNYPRDLGEWANYCAAVVRHCESVGHPVESWMWEIWNEPNNDHVSGGWAVEKYLELYDAAARALRAAYPRLRIGGPAIDRPSEDWITALLSGHDVQFITWHRYGSPNSRLHKSDADCLAETVKYGTEAAKVEDLINRLRPGEGILNVCGELNLSAYCCPTDRRIWEGLLIPWYASAMRHLLLNGCDIEQTFVGTDKSWPNYGLFLGTGTKAGLRSPGFLAKALFSAAVPPGSKLVTTTVSGSATLEALATRATEGRDVIVLINKTTAKTPVAVKVIGRTPVAGGIWYTIDQAAYGAGGIRVELAPRDTRLACTLEGYALSVLEICSDGTACHEDRDSDGLLNLFDDRPDSVTPGRERPLMSWKTKKRGTGRAQPPIVGPNATPRRGRF